MDAMSKLSPNCPVVRTLDVVGEKWSLLIVRNALRGETRFSQFRDDLGIPSDVLTARLATLVDAGILEKRAYREPGARERSSYHLTPAGEGLVIVVGAMKKWNDAFNPSPVASSMSLVDPTDGTPLDLAYVGPSGAIHESAVLKRPAA
jgi:DNA-binding HxlR family transcriptional regulator